MNDRLNSLMRQLESSGWNLIERNNVEITLPRYFSRYDYIPDEYIKFISLFKSIQNKVDTKWFLSLEDFDGSSESDFKWNEFELISLNGAEGDEEWMQEIREFWDKHIPIFISVENGYKYLAIDISVTSGALIVLGGEPEFEETSKFSQSIEGCLHRLVIEYY